MICNLYTNYVLNGIEKVYNINTFVTVEIKITKISIQKPLEEKKSIITWYKLCTTIEQPCNACDKT